MNANARERIIFFIVAIAFELFDAAKVQPFSDPRKRKNLKTRGIFPIAVIVVLFVIIPPTFEDNHKKYYFLLFIYINKVIISSFITIFAAIIGLQNHVSTSYTLYFPGCCVFRNSIHAFMSLRHTIPIVTIHTRALLH